MQNNNLNQVIRKAKSIDKVMTGILYGVGGFFLVLLVVLAGYILIKGIMDFHPSFLAFDRNGIGDQLFNT